MKGERREKCRGEWGWRWRKARKGGGEGELKGWGDIGGDLPGMMRL